MEAVEDGVEFALESGYSEVVDGDGVVGDLAFEALYLCLGGGYNVLELGELAVFDRDVG